MTTGFCNHSTHLPLPSLSLLYPLASLSCSFPLFLTLSHPSTERARLAGALRFARGHYHSLKCTRLRYTRLQHRTCKTSRGHFAFLVVSKKVPAINGDFDFFSQKTPKKSENTFGSFIIATSRGHFAFLVVLEKVPATYEDFDFFSKIP